MGTFASTVHVYTDSPLPNELGSFSCFSEGWQTMLPRNEANFEQDRKIARRLSKQLAAPVLWFWEFDSDEYGFVLFSDGKQKTVFSTESFSEPKGLYQLPPLIGYPTGNKQRLSKILSCADMECSIAMLEEYFGVCLEVFPELLETPEALKQTRSEDKYRAYLAEEKRFSGKNAPIGVELTEEIFGKVEHHPVFGDFSQPKAHIFYLAQFHSYEERTSPLPAVEFRGGKLLPADEAAIRAAKTSIRGAGGKDSRFQKEYYPKRKVTFTDDAPAPFRGKVFTVFPRGYYPYDFDLSDRLILANGRGGIAFMNADGEILSKCSLKGNLTDYRDGYFLTDSTPIFDPWGWGINPEGVLRIYRIVDRIRPLKKP